MREEISVRITSVGLTTACQTKQVYTQFHGTLAGFYLFTLPRPWPIQKKDTGYRHKAMINL